MSTIKYYLWWITDSAVLSQWNVTDVVIIWYPGTLPFSGRKHRFTAYYSMIWQMYISCNV